MDIHVRNLTGVAADVQIINLSNRGRNVPSIRKTVSHGNQQKFRFDEDSARDTYSVIVKNSSGSYDIHGRFRIDSEMLGKKPTLVLAVDRVGDGDQVMDFETSGKHIKYFAKCENGEIHFKYMLGQEEYEDIVEEGPTTILGLICRSRHLTIANMNGSKPIGCGGVPVVPLVLGSIILLLFIIFLVIIFIAGMIAILGDLMHRR